MDPRDEEYQELKKALGEAVCIRGAEAVLAALRELAGGHTH